MKRNIFLPILIALSVVCGVYLGNRLARQNAIVTLPLWGASEKDGLKMQSSDKLSTIVNLIESVYVDTVSKQKLVETAIAGLLQSLDPHSAYIPASDMQEVNEEMHGSFGGIGIQFSIVDDTVRVVDVISEGPSYKLGILPGDRIVEINDSIIAGTKTKNDDITKLLKGPKGTKVKVGIKRAGVSEIIPYNITRGEIPLFSVDVNYMVNDSLGYIKISRFAETTYDEFMKAMEQLDSLNASKVIIDLRSNLGGSLMTVLRMVSEFLEKGEEILYTEGKARPRETFKAPDKGKWVDKEVFVLIDEYSASASEIFAGAMQDNDRGVIIGRRSFGKGLVQEQILFKDGSALRLTVSRYYTPSGRSIQKPYNEGRDKYYHNIIERRIELVVPDSIHFADSLRFETKSGRDVYGEGGIMPDFFVPIDTIGYSEYFSKIYSKSLVYSFAMGYSDKYRTVLNRFKTADEIAIYLEKQDIDQQFYDYAVGKGIPRDPVGIRISGEIIKTQVMAYIARNIIGDAGFFPIIHRIDNTMIKAVDLASSQDLMKQLIVKVQN